MSPSAWKLLHIFWVCVTVPMLIPVRLPLNFPVSDGKNAQNLENVLAEKHITSNQTWGESKKINGVITSNFGNSKGEADRRVSEWHDSGHNWEPRNLIKIWDLGENDFHRAKHDHIGIAWNLARIFPMARVEAIRPLDCPICYKPKQPIRPKMKKKNMAVFGYRERVIITTHIMLIDAAIVYPIATPKRFMYWMNPHILTLNPPEKKINSKN